METQKLNDVEKFLKTLSKIGDFRYRTISEYAKDLIIAIDESFEIEHINKKAFQTILGYAIGDVNKNERLEIIHPRDRQKLINELENLFKGQERIFTLQAKHKNGKYLYFEVNGKIYRENDVKKALLIARDITERKEAEQELKKAYNLLDIVKDVFNHDITNLLQNINSAIQLIEQDLNTENKINTKKLRERINTIKTQIIRANKLSSDVRKISKIEKSEFTLEKIEILNLLENAREFILHSFPERNIHISIQHEKKGYYIRANELLQDVFENILMNAVKFNIENVIKIIIKIRDKNNMIRIEFIDNGIGIVDKKKKQIFQSKSNELEEVNDVKGLGIGLSLVKKIVQKSNGKIWVEDRVPKESSKGSKFIITFPKSI